MSNVNTHNQPARHGVTPAEIKSARKKIQFFVWLTIAWSAVEAIVGIKEALRTDSAALLGFGLDAVIEVISALTIQWQFIAHNYQRREKIALRIVAIALCALSFYIIVDSVLALAQKKIPQDSEIGIVLSLVSVIIMPIVSAKKRAAGQKLHSQSAITDSKQTLLCTYLSIAALMGLVANYLWDFWWADPIAGLVIAALAAKEGLDAWGGKSCCDHMREDHRGIDEVTEHSHAEDHHCCAS